MFEFKRELLFLCVVLLSKFCFAQTNPTSYYLEILEGHELGTISKTTNPDQSLNLTFNNTSLAQFLNTETVYELEAAYPTAETSRLQRVYLMKADNDFPAATMLQRSDVDNFFLIDESEGENILDTDNLFVIPNDYTDVLTGTRNSSLDLIQAPLAWPLSTGTNTLVGVSDAAASLVHDDLNGQFFDTILIGSHPNQTHGVGVSGVIAARTDNNSHVSSLAHDSKIVFAHTNGGAVQLIDGLLQLSQYPNVKVINCSWSISETSPFKDDLDAVMSEVELNGVLVVGTAGNANTGAYRYPGSYDGALSVTTVGNRYPIGFNHNFSHDHPNGDVWQTRSWNDVHLLKPHLTGNTESNNHNDKVDVCAPGQLTTNITNDFTNFPDGIRVGGATSTAAPYVTSVAALVYSIKPDLTPLEVKDIIKNSADDIYHIPYNQDYIGQLGTGRINAYRAALTTECLVNPSTEVDLAIQNSNLDYFNEPDINTPIPWLSDDIWVRNQNDGNLIDVHQNPEYDSNNPNYAYVRVTNNSCVSNSGSDVMKLYWAKANTALAWPQHWDGSLFIQDPVTGENILMGDEVGTLNIPALEIGESTVLEFEWNIPNPEDYLNINENPWHFCLLARIESPDDPMAFPEDDHITSNVVNNNNIGWKNTTVVDIFPDVPSPVTSVVGVGNPDDVTRSYNLELVKEENETGKALYDEAEITITLDDTVYNAWNNGGQNSANFLSTNQSNIIIVQNDHALIEDIQFAPNEIGTVSLSFNFLTDELTNKQTYVYHLIQKDAVTDEVIGGETFVINKYPRPIFSAEAGNDTEINRDETVTLTAGTINESATYNWYDPEGNLIHTGVDLTVTPDITKTYKLEIVADIGGFKDYDEVQVTVNPYRIESLVPNPTSSLVTVSYLAEGATSAYVMVVNTNTGDSDNYILDTALTSTSLDVSNFDVGLYNIILVCDGEIQNSKSLIKQ